MEGIGNDRRDLVRAIYEQHWLQIRQVQRERLWLVLVVSVISAGALIAMGGNFSQSGNWPLVVFLMILSLLGLFLSIKMQIVIRAHLGAIELILSRYSLQHYMPRYRQSFSRNILRISRMIPKFFLFCFSFFLWMLLFIIGYNWWWSALVAAAEQTWAPDDSQDRGNPTQQYRAID